MSQLHPAEYKFITVQKDRPLQLIVASVTEIKLCRFVKRCIQIDVRETEHILYQGSTKYSKLLQL